MITRTEPTRNAALLMRRNDVYSDRPAVLDAVQNAARLFATVLADEGSAHIALEPGDATRYTISVVALPAATAYVRGGRHLIVYGDRALTISLTGLLTPDYVASKLELRNAWTAAVLALFLTTVGDLLPE